MLDDNSQVRNEKMKMIGSLSLFFTPFLFLFGNAKSNQFHMTSIFDNL